MRARIALRKEALKGYDLLVPHCVALIKSSLPFEHLRQEEVDTANLEFLRLNFPMTDLLKLSKGSAMRERNQGSA